jgi:hypothetical protein
MHTNRWFSQVLAAAFTFTIILSTIPSFAQQSTKGKAAETATLQLLQMHKNYQQSSATQKQQLLTQFTTMAAQRQQLLSSLIQTNPADVLRVAVPNEISQTMPTAVKGYVEQSVTAQGVLEVLYEMQGRPEKTTGTILHHFLQTSTGRLGLHFAASAPTHLLTGSVVRVNGVRVSNDVALASGTNSTSFQTVSAASLPGTFGQVNTLVIMVNFQDNPVQPWTSASVQNTVFTQTSNWDLENSFQQTWLTGDVTNWLTIPVNSSNCDYTSIKSYAQTTAKNAGYNLTAYSHYIYAFPLNSGCSWWGLATIGGGDVWINNGVQVKVVSHEMGHNFGLYHSHTTDCGTAAVCSTGTLSEYGDWIDTMGTPQSGHYSAFQKERLGWLNNGAQPPVITVAASGTYQIGPYEAQDNTPKALKIFRSGSSSSYYYVELRQAQGQDAFLTGHSDVLNGVVVHSASTSDPNSNNLLDMTATSPSSFSVPALVAGQSYTDSAAGITITPVSVSSTGASVQVTLGTAACTNVKPTVSVSPSQSQYVSAGTMVNFTTTVKNNDSSTCAPATFNLTDVVGTGWAGAWNTTALTVAPGASGSGTLSVSSPIGTADGFYNVAVTASNASAGAYSNSTNATYVVSTPLPVTATVSTNQSIYSAGQTVLITVSVLSGGSPDGGASVSVSVTPPGKHATTLTATTGSNGVASLTYKLQKRALKGTYLVQATPVVPGASSTTGASTTFVVQ